MSCDYAGADAVVRAYRRAAASGTQLRLVVTATIVRRVLGVNGLDRLIPVYLSWKRPLPPDAGSGGLCDAQAGQSASGANVGQRIT